MVTPEFAGSENKGPTQALNEITVPLLRCEMDRVAEEKCHRASATPESVGQAERSMAGLCICGLYGATGL